jgi:multidrug efflux pump subunit AcrA (membrane-fusion protein)
MTRRFSRGRAAGEFISPCSLSSRALMARADDRMSDMHERSSASWLVFALGVLCAGAIAAAFLVVGPASGSQTTITRTATVAQGVVQSTVSGSGNLEALSQLNLGFRTGGTVTHVEVHVGEQVAAGELLAELDPQSAEVTLEQARASLQSAEANLATEEETDGEGSSGGAQKTSSPTNSSDEAVGNGEATRQGEGVGSRSSTSGSISQATREANLASARAQVRSDTLTVQSDEQAVRNTKLYAPESGTIVSLSGEVGEVVSASGTTRATSASASAGSSSTGASGAGGSSASGAANASSSSGSTGSSSSAFAVLSDLSSMQLVAPLSESEIGSVKAGQIATVSVEALSGHKLAAHVSNIAILSTSNSGVVSYDVTFRLEQTDPGLKPGMSATADVVVEQAEGINVPTSAISGGTVTVVRGGRHIRQPVVSGLAGDSSTLILSGLKAGETVVLPSLSTSTAASSSGGRFGALGGLSGAGGLGGRGAGGGGGGAAFLRGGG